MSTELVLLLGIFAFVLLGIFSQLGGTFKSASPRLAAKIERNITIGHKFKENGRSTMWEKFD